MSSAGKLLCTRATVLQGRNGQAQATQELCRQTRVAQRDEHALIPLCEAFLSALGNSHHTIKKERKRNYQTAQIGCQSANDIGLCHTKRRSTTVSHASVTRV